MASPQYGQLILFGDSITEWSTNPHAGFALQPALQWFYTRRLDVINRGFSGYNTQHALKILPSIIPAPSSASVKLLVVFFGANDAATPQNPSRQHVPLEEFASNLRALLTHSSVKAHAPAIVVVTPPPIDEERLAENDPESPDGRLAAVTARYATAARKVASELAAEPNARVACCDLWRVMIQRAGGSGDPEQSPLPGDRRAPRNEVLRKLLTDGLHFTPAAYELCFGALKETILKSFPELDPEKIPSVFPGWREAPKK